MEVLQGVKLSLGSVSALQRQVSAALASPVQTAQSYVQRQPVNHVDETSWYQQVKLHWLWLAATEAVTVFRLLAGRGSAQAKQVISKTARGIIITDRYNAYNWLPLQRRQLCWAHLKRDFQAMADILQVEPCLWTFARRAGVEPTNNNAERALRRAVLWRKKSFGTQSETGSRFVERILTVVTTLRQQGRDVLDYLTAACSGGVGDSHLSLSLLPEPP